MTTININTYIHLLWICVRIYVCVVVHYLQPDSEKQTIITFSIIFINRDNLNILEALYCIMEISNFMGDNRKR